jgi:uncharacterized protein
MENWISPKTIVGTTAVGDYYFNRPQIVSKIWEEVLKGSHVLLAAPRRVGKSSVMEYMVASHPNELQCIFRNIQAIKSEQEFYQKIYELLILCLSKVLKTTKSISDFLGRINVTEITTSGVKFGDKKEINYLDEINQLLPKLSSNNLKIVLFIDELPEVLNNMYKAKKIEEASSILENLRQWRQTPEFKKHFSLVLAGSVGIHHVVKKIKGRVADLNDLNQVPFEPLFQEESREYIKWATDEATVQYDENLQDYLLDKIAYPLPYFINLMLGEINAKAQKIRKESISTDDIDTAFNKVIKQSDHFTEWRNRLFTYFPNDEADFLDEILLFIGHKNKISPRQLYNLAGKHKMTKNYIELMDGLERDGYITEQSDNYVFVSPFLKAFWKRTNPFYDGK